MADFKLKRPWCSTKVDPLTSEHDLNGEFYGYCPEDGSCLSEEKGQEILDHVNELALCKSLRDHEARNLNFCCTLFLGCLY